MNDAWLGLMSAAGGTPYLDGAACRGRPELFDLEPKSDPELLERAQHMCRSCPALAACQSWVAATPAYLRPVGVVAGELLGPPPAAPRLKPNPEADGRWLVRHLAGRGGSELAVRVIAAAADAGIAEARLRQAKRRLGVVSDQSGHTSVWLLPGAKAAA